MYKYIAESQLLPDIPIQKNTHRFVIFSLVYCDRTPPSIVSLNIFIFSQKKGAGAIALRLHETYIQHMAVYVYAHIRSIPVKIRACCFISEKDIKIFLSLSSPGRGYIVGL